MPVNTKKKPVGRPRRSRKVSEARLVARCSAAELEAAARAAEKAQLSLSNYIRAAVAYVNDMGKTGPFS